MIWLGRPGISGPGILSVGAGLRRAGGGGAAFVPEFLLRDDFTTDEAAPLASPRDAEPGPGTLTITDTAAQLSISGGQLSFATGLADDPAIRGDAVSRSAGVVLVTTLTVSVFGSHGIMGWGGVSGAPSENYISLRTAVLLRVLANGVVVEVGSSLTADTPYELALVLRGAGAFFVIRGGSQYLDWTLLWSESVGGTSSLHPAIMNGTAIMNAETMRVTDLPAPWDTDFGIATERLAGARSVNDEFTHEADCILEYEVTTIGSQSNALQFRRQDNDNLWRVRITSVGTINLDEIVAGTPTTRGQAASAASNGSRIVVIADDEVIRVYSDNVLRFTYSSAVNFKTATAGKLTSVGTDGVISDIVSWPRIISGAAKSALDKVVA